MTTPNTTATTDERDKAQRALALRLGGGTWAQIAAQLGYADESGARKAANALLDRVDHHLADEFRDLEGARLERLLVAVWPAAVRGDLAAVEAARKLIESRTRLYGLARAVKLELSTTVTDEEFAATAARLMAEIGAQEPPLQPCAPVLALAEADD